MRLALLLALLAAATIVGAAEAPLAIHLQQVPQQAAGTGETQYFVDLGGTQRGISLDAMRAFEPRLNRRPRDLRA